MRKSPLEAQDVRGVEEPRDGDTVEGENKPGMSQDRGEEEHAISPENEIDLVSRVTKSSLEAQDGSIEEPSRVQSDKIEAQGCDNRDIEILGVENNQIPQIVELLEEYSHIDMIPKFEANRWARAFRTAFRSEGKSQQQGFPRVAKIIEFLRLAIALRKYS
jgi:hypothetical protein